MSDVREAGRVLWADHANDIRRVVVYVEAARLASNLGCELVGYNAQIATHPADSCPALTEEDHARLLYVRAREVNDG